ncbi:hypothetical protein [Saccharothrix longispora]|uniref:hypothetical protein n=1 Tax=Saccharothrix longispora TaxID=33920 RepID=UPI0028FD8F98|nr:hypothetical protein [Saccharothrix longispora]MBY8849106.1 hypothetical protein [Saccharothrix sp. MB29]MDU0290564.1 hypothetical protein [Saccharothrix longispora]
MFNHDPIQRHAGPPASSTPTRDYLNTRPPGVDEGYAVLPRSLVEAMPLPWQQQMAHLLADFHRTYGHLNWPLYRVVPSRRERLVDLDEEQLAEVGAIVEIDADGELVYRDRTGKLIADPERQTVLVSVLDPIPGEYANANQNTPPRGFPQPPAVPQPAYPQSGPLPVQQAPGRPAPPPRWP